MWLSLPPASTHGFTSGKTWVMRAAKCMQAFLMYTSKNFHFPVYQLCSRYPTRFRTAEARMDSQVTSDTYGDRGSVPLALLCLLAQGAAWPVPTCFLDSSKINNPQARWSRPSINTHQHVLCCPCLSTCLHMFSIYSFWKGHGDLGHFSTPGPILTKDRAKIQRRIDYYNQERWKS